MKLKNQWGSIPNTTLKLLTNANQFEEMLKAMIRCSPAMIVDVFVASLNLSDDRMLSLGGTWGANLGFGSDAQRLGVKQ